MKEMIRKIVRWLSTMPLIGRLVRIATAIWRLPQLRAELAGLREQITGHEAAYPIMESAYREQLPALLDAMSRLNAKQHAFDSDQQNLVASVPVALREMRREISQVASVQAITANYMDELKSKQAITANCMDELKSNCGYLFGRVEFIRRELMLEMRYGQGSRGAEADELEVTTRVIAIDKLERARETGLRLNLGCGHIPLEGFINVDRRDVPGVDVVAEINALPEEIREVDEIFSSHMLEHFPQEQLRRELLPYWRSLLKKGGVIRAVVPDAEAMIREYTAGKYPYDDMREVFYGGQDYTGDFHFNMFTPEHMTRLLEEAGFESIDVIDAGRRNGKCFEFEITAKRP